MYVQKQAKNNINSDTITNFIPIINANCSIIEGAIKDSFNRSTNHIKVDNQNKNNNKTNE